jgi:cell division protein FtsL
MTLRITTILWMVLLVIGAFGVYMVKYKVRAIKTEVAATERQLTQEKRSTHVLTAEWTYLNRPERLKTLSAKYLDIKPMRGQQIAEFSSLPYTVAAGTRQEVTHSGSMVKLISGGRGDGGTGGE